MPKKPNYKKYLIPAILILVIIVLGIIFSPSVKSPSNKVLYVTSSDGSAKLTIPSSALPDGTKLEDIKITKKKYEELPIEKLDQSQITAYSLEPDGLKFVEPVSVSISGTLQDGSIPILYHISDSGESENLKKTHVTVDLEKKTASVSADITHFSDIVADFYGIFKIYIAEGGRTYYVNQSFPVTVTITPTGRIWNGGPTGKLYKGYAKGNTYDVNNYRSAILMSLGGVLQPTGARTMPNTKGLKEGEKYEFSVNYSCSKEGSDSIVTNPVEINYTANYYSENASGDEEEWTLVTLREAYKCLKADGGFKMIDPPSLYLDAGVSQ